MQPQCSSFIALRWLFTSGDCFRVLICGKHHKHVVATDLSSCSIPKPNGKKSCFLPGWSTEICLFLRLCLNSNVTSALYLFQVLECGEEKVLTLTEVERIKALAAQLVKLLRAQKNSSLPVSQLLTEYSKTFGYGLRLQDYDASSLPALLTKLCHVVKVKDTYTF